MNFYRAVRGPRDDERWRPSTAEVLDHVIARRLRNNQNWLGVLCGQTGSGKSYSAMRIGEMVDPNFTHDSIVFSTAEFLESFESRSPGEMVVFDEGQEWSSRRAMSKKNVEMAEILAMLRFTRVNVLFTLPNIRMIDIALRRLLHSYLYVTPIDRTKCHPRMRDKSLVHLYDVISPRLPGAEDIRGGVRYAHPLVPVVRGGSTMVAKTGSMLLEKPAQALVDAYEARKADVFRDRLSRARQTFVAPPAAPPDDDSPADELPENSAIHLM